MSTISAKDLEERGKKIFDALGLKNLDIKVWQKDSNGETEHHVHVDEKGATVDGASSGNQQKKVEDKAQPKSADTFEKQIQRLTDGIGNVFNFLSGDITKDQMTQEFKRIFEQRLKDQFGIENDPMAYIKEIQKTSKNLLNNVFFTNLQSRLKDIGVDIDLSQKAIDEAADELIKKWGYDVKKTAEPKPQEKKQNPDVNASKASTEKSKAQILKETLLREKEEKAQREKEEIDKKIRVIKTTLDSCIRTRNFQFTDNVITIRVRLNMPAEVWMANQAAKSIKDEYGFSTCSNPYVDNDGVWIFKFGF